MNGLLTTDADSKDGASVNEELLKFKPSPNFRNMKKFLKSRMGDTDNASMLDSPESPTLHEEIQPPLPLDPPPSDEVSPDKSHPSTPHEMDDKSVLLTIPKQERTSPEPEIKCEVSIDYMDETKPPKALKPINQICKDFIRGNCSWVGCKYRHEIDLTQLRGIFIFCHNFQNSVCTKPNCRYVHASVFDEQRFYRTGELPKVLMQKTEQPSGNASASEGQKFMLPPPPPPPPPPTSDSEVTTDSNNTFVVNVSKPPPVIMAKPEEQLLGGVYGHSPTTEPKSPKSCKRAWSDPEEGLSEMFNCTSPQDNDSRSKRHDGKCGSCKVMENRLKFAFNKMQDLIKSATESESKMARLERKHKFLLQVASALTSASAGRPTERESVSVNQSPGAIFSQVDIQQALHQSNVVAEQLSHFKDEQKKMSTQQSNLTAQLKHYLQAPPLYNKINNNDDNGSKAYQLSNQHIVQLPPPTSSNAQYQLQSSSISSVPNDPNSIRLGNMGPPRQLNLLNGW